MEVERCVREDGGVRWERRELRRENMCTEENEMKAWVTFENMEVRFYYILITWTTQIGAIEFNKKMVKIWKTLRLKFDFEFEFCFTGKK